MSDFNSQGRTPPVNPIHITECFTCQSIYTLKLTGGLSGALRREFRELEILNEITHLRCEGNLFATVSGTTRASLIRSYQELMGPQHIPCSVPAALDWSNEPLSSLEPPEEPPVWSLSPHSAKKTNTINQNTYQSVSPSASLAASTNSAPPHQSDRRLGLKWDSVNYSCAYDALCTVLFNISTDYADHPIFHINSTTGDLVAAFISAEHDSASLEVAHDAM
ncbi:hypothetical protein OH76DRAFT_1455199 [Lentinus brumalis]|uniref:Uncharacterized protein n=1 Tax=Lentinus brumalis TaxID=2498619 RepID=A0A371DEN8_9APHY|nr:hypothetical protein OH76DRAFT_1455199 [Polyporus brumalis]